MIAKTRSRTIAVLLLGAALAAGLAPLCGCATIIRGPRQPVRIDCGAKGAVVKLNDVKVEPGAHELRRETDYVVRVEAPGHIPRTLQIQRRFSPGYLVGDIFFTALIGLVVDAVNGSWYRLEPEILLVDLEPEGAPPPPPPPPKK